MVNLSSCLENERLVVLDVDGTIVAVDGGPPASWVGRRYDACPGFPEQVGAMARALVHESSLSAPLPVVRSARVALASPPGVTFTLVLARALFLEPASVELGTLLREVLEPLVKQAQSMFVKLTFHDDVGGSNRVVIDPTKIAWALTTLVGSALRHVDRGSAEKPGGRVRVQLRHNPQQARLIITVEDDGHGIQAGVRAWLFEPKPETGISAGVALRLVDEVVAAHGGRLVIHTPLDARAGRGTEVNIWLPIAT